MMRIAKWVRVAVRSGVSLYVGTTLLMSVASHAQAQPSAGDPPPPVAAPPPQAPTCNPPCRSRFTCVEGSCVSLCNPPCEDGSSCSASGECVAAQTATPAAPRSPEPRTADASAVADRSGFVFVLRVGLMLSGAGKLEVEQSCSPSTSCNAGTNSADYDDATRFQIEPDVLFYALPNLRLGLGVMLTPGTEIESDDSTPPSIEMGTEIAPLGIVEGVFGGAVAGALRVFAGPAIRIAGGDLEDAIEGTEQLCQDFENTAQSAGMTASCDVNGSPFLGFTLGAGGGVVAQVDDAVALRTDLALQYVSIAGAGFELASGGETGELSTAFSGTRLWLTVGLEL